VSSGLPVEMLARVLHAAYVARSRARGCADGPALATWDDLPEDLKVSNRASVMDITAKLAAIDCQLEEGGGAFSFTSEQVERLARMEHERWATERLAAGWTHGSAKDPSTKTSPYLIPYDDLPEEIRELDRENVRAIPALVSAAGLHIVSARS